MTIEQTKGFRMDVEHMAHLVDEYRYTCNCDRLFAEHLQKVVKYRGKDYAIKAAKKANQKAKHKAYLWESI